MIFKHFDPLPVNYIPFQEAFHNPYYKCIINMQFSSTFNYFQHTWFTVHIIINIHDTAPILQYSRHMQYHNQLPYQGKFYNILPLNQNITNVLQLKTYIKLLSPAILQNLNTRLQIDKHVRIFLADFQLTFPSGFFHSVMLPQDYYQGNGLASPD